MSSDVIISVESLSKRYHLGEVGVGSLRETAEHWWHKARGRNPRVEMGVVGGDSQPSRTEKLDSQNSSDFVWALNGVSFEVRRGEVLGIIGKNGAGKSTLLKILSRITEPTSGRAVLNGRVGSLLEVGTGFHPELTGRENVFLNGAILGMKRREVDDKFDEIVAFSEVEKFIDTPVKRYSSGMYVRLAFAVAAHLSPEILLVDEVLAVGDAEFQKKCLGKMGDIAKAGRTVLFVSHNMGAIAALCPRSVLLVAGAIQEDATSAVCIDHYIDHSSRSEKESLVLHLDPKSEKLTAHFRRISICDEHGEALKSVDSSVGFEFVFEYRVMRYCSALEVSFVLLDSFGRAVFHSFASSDGGGRSADVGDHRAAAIVPADLLMPGRYSIRAGLHRPNLEVYDLQDNILSFFVVESSSVGYKYAGADVGVVDVNLRWESD